MSTDVAACGGGYARHRINEGSLSVSSTTTRLRISHSSASRASERGNRSTAAASARRRATRSRSSTRRRVPRPHRHKPEIRAPSRMTLSRLCGLSNQGPALAHARSVGTPTGVHLLIVRGLRAETPPRCRESGRPQRGDSPHPGTIPARFRDCDRQVAGIGFRELVPGVGADARAGVGCRRRL
jgi:hypothetical protein